MNQNLIENHLKLITSFNTIENIKKLSIRCLMKRFLAKSKASLNLDEKDKNSLLMDQNLIENHLKLLTSLNTIDNITNISFSLR